MNNYNKKLMLELKKALKGCTYGDINDKKYVGDQFTTYLSEFSSDVSKFKKNIKIVEK